MMTASHAIACRSRTSKSSQGGIKMLRLSTILLTLLLLAACGSKEEKKEEEPVRPVQLGEVTEETLPRTIVADGVLRALDQSAVMPKISAPVSRFLVNR